MKSPILTGWKMIANFLNVHPETAEAWALNKGLPVAKIGKSIIASKNQLQAWIIKNAEKKGKF